MDENEMNYAKVAAIWFSIGVSCSALLVAIIALVMRILK